MENSIYLKSIPLVIEDHGTSLLKALHDQQKKSQLCDVELVVGNEKFSAHKAVLAAYSLYFQALFDRGTQSDDAGSKVCNVTTIHLSSITANTFIPILHFLYTSRLHLFSENIGEIIRTARKLQIPTIVKACERLLNQDITLPSIKSVRSANHCNSLMSDSTQSVLYVDLKSEDDEERVTSSEQAPYSINYSLLSEDEKKKVVSSDLSFGNISQQNRTQKQQSYQKTKSSLMFLSSTVNSVQLKNISSISAPLYGSSGLTGQPKQQIVNQSSPMLSSIVTGEIGSPGIMSSALKLPSAIPGSTKMSVDPSSPFHNNLSLGTIFGNDQDFMLDECSSENLSSTHNPTLSFPCTSSEITDSLKLQNSVMANSFTLMPSNSSLYSQNAENTSIYTCKECFKYFTNISDALYHFYSEHQNTTKSISCISGSNPINHNCPHCGRVFNNKNNLKRHILIKHRTDHRFKCSNCGRKYAIRQSLQYHMRTMHNMELVEDKLELKNKSHKTNLTTFPNIHSDVKTSTINHSSIVVPNNELYSNAASSSENAQINEYTKYNAPNTPNSYLNSQPVHLPSSSKTNKEDKKEEICPDPKENVVLPTIHNIKSIRSIDMQTMENSKNDSSNFSGHVKTEPQCISTSSLVKNTDIFTGHPFILSGQNNSLPIILSTVSQEYNKKTEGQNLCSSKVNPPTRYHRCEICHRSFSTMQSYSRHRRSCNKHKCPNCHRGFSQMANMRRHFKIFHCEQKPYQCRVCNKAYGLEQSFRYHMRDKHGIDTVSNAINLNKQTS